jgi:hypothetical protein
VAIEDMVEIIPKTMRIQEITVTDLGLFFIYCSLSFNQTGFYKVAISFDIEIFQKGAKFSIPCKTVASQMASRVYPSRSSKE